MAGWCTEYLCCIKDDFAGDIKLINLLSFLKLWDSFLALQFKRIWMERQMFYYKLSLNPRWNVVWVGQFHSVKSVSFHELIKTV